MGVAFDPAPVDDLLTEADTTGRRDYMEGELGMINREVERREAQGFGRPVMTDHDIHQAQHQQNVYTRVGASASSIGGALRDPPLEALLALQSAGYQHESNAQAAIQSNGIEPIEGFDAFLQDLQPKVPMRGTHLTVDSAERKEVPIATGVLDYFPDALADVARLSKIGNDKHNPGEPLHWARGKSMDNADCILRHMIERGTIDTDGVLHDTKVAWRALAQLQLTIEKLRAEGSTY